MPPSMLPCAHSKQNDIQLKQHTNNAIVPACCTSRPSHDSSKEGKPLNLLLVTSTTSPGAAEQQRRQSVSVQLCLLMLLQKKKKETTIWWQPDCLPIDTALIFALALLYVCKKMGGWIYKHTLTHINMHKHSRQLFALMRSPISVYFEI